MDTPYLTVAEYEAVIRAGLSRHGIGSDAADSLLRARWPMDSAGFISELSGRGRLLGPDDLADWLADRFGQRVEPDELSYFPWLADAALSWAVARGRGRPTLAADVVEHAPELIEQALRAGAFKCN